MYDVFVRANLLIITHHITVDDTKDCDNLVQALFDVVVGHTEVVLLRSQAYTVAVEIIRVHQEIRSEVFNNSMLHLLHRDFLCGV